MRWYLQAVVTLSALAGGLATAQLPSPGDKHFSVPPEHLRPGEAATYPVSPAALGITIPRIIGDTKVDRRLNDPRTVYYKLPPIWQHWVPASRTEHRNRALGSVYHTQTPAVWGVHPTSFLADFNANPDFPWEVTFGLNLPHRESVAKKTAPLYDTINFLSLPEDEEGQLIPVVVLTDERPIKWLFPPGTMVGEVIYVTHKGKRYVQEIRTRTKNPPATTWFPGVYRPVKDRQELQLLTRIAYEPSRRYMSFRNPEEDEVFRIEGTVEKLPDLPEAVVTSLLSRPFQDVTESDWHPASDTDFNILPRDYSLGLLKHTDSEACANCHRQTQISVRNLIPHEPKIQANPLKVGNIRGSDAVFTWHPFSYLSVQDNNVLLPAREVYLRRFDVSNGVVEMLKAGQKPRHTYLLTEFVQKSLKPYELPLDKQFLHPEKGCQCGATCPCLADGGKCTCGDKCDCTATPDLKQVLDGRVVLPAPPSDRVVRVNVNQAPARVTLSPAPSSQPTQAPVTDGYTWSRGGEVEADNNFWFLFRQGQLVGYAPVSSRVYVPLIDGKAGAPTTPPIPVPQGGGS